MTVASRAADTPGRNTFGPERGPQTGSREIHAEDIRARREIVEGKGASIIGLRRATDTAADSKPASSAATASTCDPGNRTARLVDDRSGRRRSGREGEVLGAARAQIADVDLVCQGPHVEPKGCQHRDRRFPYGQVRRLEATVGIRNRVFLHRRAPHADRDPLEWTVIDPVLLRRIAAPFVQPPVQRGRRCPSRGLSSGYLMSSSASSICRVREQMPVVNPEPEGGHFRA